MRYSFDLDATWSSAGDGVWTCIGSCPGELEYAMTVTAAFDHVDVDVALTNRSDRDWQHSMAFNCFSAIAAPSVSDFECTRHWCRSGSRLRRLIEMPRRFSLRPTLQAYSVAGAPRAPTVPFVASFDCTPGALLEDWLAIQARDGARIVAAVSRPALFLFHNMELSCIHAAQGFGPLGPDQTGQARTRLYLAQATVPAWYARMRSELG